MRRVISILLTLSLLLSLTACGGMQAQDLTENIQPQPVEQTANLPVNRGNVTDFGVRLFRCSAEAGENTLISPISVLCALAMTANGAKGETLAQMEAVLGMDAEELNAFLHTYLQSLPEEEKYKLSLANSIWFTEDESFTVEQTFLQTVSDYYGAGIYQAPFDDTTLKDINNWVKEQTDGMIPSILDEIPPEAVMYLVNALAFDAEWQKIYEESQVRDGEFTTEDGRKQKTELMYSSEHSYLEDENAAGFLKYYAGRRYAFAALLPKEDVSVEEYVATLTGEHLHELLANPQAKEVQAGIPKFETEYSTEMSEVLMELGMTDAFDWTVADFTGLGSSTEGNIVISRVLHKTFIGVNEKGTRAGAATAVEMVAESAAEPMEEPKRVILDRPFVYLLIDCENSLPLFIGTLMEVDET